MPGLGNKKLYNGKDLVDDFGLNWYHYGARWYDPQLGRWTTMDPADEFHSPYCYVGNDPIDFIDPDGRQVDYAGAIDPTGYVTATLRADYNYIVDQARLAGDAIVGSVSSLSSGVSFTAENVSKGANISGYAYAGTGLLALAAQQYEFAIPLFAASYASFRVEAVADATLAVSKSIEYSITGTDGLGAERAMANELIDIALSKASNKITMGIVPVPAVSDMTRSIIQTNNGSINTLTNVAKDQTKNYILNNLIKQP